MHRLLHHRRPHPLDPIPRQRNPIQRLAVTRQHRIPQPLQRHVYLRLHRDGHGLHLCRLVDGIQCARRLLRAAFVTIIHCRDPAAHPERAIRVPAGLFLHAWLGWVPRQRRSVSVYDGVHCDILVPVCPACHSAGYELHFANHVGIDDFRWGVVAV